MNIYKLLKPVVPAVLVVSAIVFTAGCSSSSDGTPSDSDEPTTPPVPLAGGITGIWDGTLTWETNRLSSNYKVTMMFHTPDGAEEGVTGAIAFGDGPNDPDVPHFLFEGGYQYFADQITSDKDIDTGITKTITCEGDVWAVGRFGTKGTFVQEFSYITGSAAGPEQRGAGCLYLEDADEDGFKNELTGQFQFEDGGRFNVALTYSEDNTKDVSLDDLGMQGSDEGTDDVEYHLWSNDNSGNYMNYTAISEPIGNFFFVQVAENHSDPSVDCTGNLSISKVADQNLFTLRTPEDDDVSSECNVTTPGEKWPDDITLTAYDVDLPYSGLGALRDLDDDGNLEFIHLMASQGSGAGFTSQVLYNQFIVQ